jgi:hypothetical protein
MTSPAGHGSDVNLAALWVPIMPETSHLGEKMREEGSKARRSFEEGFSGGGSGAQQLGERHAEQFIGGFTGKFSQANFGLGISRAFDALTSQVDAKLAARLETQIPKAFKAAERATSDYETALRRAAPTQQLNAELTERISALTAKHADLQAKAAQEQAANGATTSRWVDITRESNNVLTERNRLQSQQIGVSGVLREHEEGLTASHRKAADAQEHYNELLNRHAEASRFSLNMTSALGGMLGGAMVLGIQGVIGGFEKLIELGFHVFEGAVEGAEKLADKLIEVGEDYAHLGIQVTEFSDASGSAFSEMQQHVENVYATLDVGGKNLGQTYASLGAMLGVSAGPALDELSKNVTELQGRFSSLKAEDLGSIFIAFKVPVDQLNSSLDTLVQAGQQSGRGLGEIVKSLSGDAAATLTTAGFSLGQAAHFVGELEKHGLPARSVMMGLGSAMKEFGKHGLDFREGIARSIDDLTRLGNTAAGDKLASTLFGGRRWTEVMQMVPALKQLIESTADSYDAPIGKTREFLEATADLGNKFEEFKHHVEDALAPLAKHAVEAVEGGLNRISGWFDTHQDSILEQIRQWGDSFLHLLPTLIDVGEGIVSFGAMVGEVVAPLIAGFGQMAAAALIAKGVLTGDQKAWDAGDKLWGAMTKFAETDFSKPTDKINDFLNNLKSKVPDATQDWDNFWDKASGKDVPLPAVDYNAPLPPSISGVPLAPPGPPGSPHVAPGIPGTPGIPSTPGPGIGRGGGDGGLKDLYGPPTNDTTIGHAGGTEQRRAVAQTIYNSVTGAGYSSKTGLAAVAAAMHEDPNLSPATQEGGGSDHWGLFQEQGNYPGAHGGVMDQISWFINEMNTQGGPAVADADPATFIANRVEKGGYSGKVYDLSAAASLVGVSGVQSGGFPRGFAEGGLDHGHTHPGGGPGIGTPDWGPGTKWGPPPPDWWSKPIDPDDILFPQFMPPGERERWLDRWGKKHKRTKAFQSGGQPLSAPIGGPSTPGFDPHGDYGTNIAHIQDKRGMWWPGIGDKVAKPGFPQGRSGWAGSQPGMPGFKPGTPKGLPPWWFGEGKQGGGRGPKDTVPAWITPKEYVWNEEAVDKYGPFIHWANEEAQGRATGLDASAFMGAKGFQGGGGGNGAANYAASGRGNDMPELVDPQLQYIMGIANSMGLTLTAGKSGHGTHDIDQGWHDSGQAGDFGNGRDTPEETAFAQAMFQHFGSELSELIYAGPGMPKLIKDGNPVDPMFYGADTLAGHHDHVHVAIKATQTLSDVMSPGSEPLVPGSAGGGFGATPLSFGSGGSSGGGSNLFGGGYGGGAGPGGSVGPRGFAGLPGQYGGFGAYGGETQDEVEQHRRAIEHANDTVKGINRQIEDKRAEIKTLEKEAGDLDADTTITRDQAKIDAKNLQLRRAREDLDKLQGQTLPEAEADVGTAERKAQEAALKPPEKGKSGRDEAGTAAHDFGSKFLGGVAQSLGFPDVFGGKAPWDFGIVKSLGRFMTGFMGDATKSGKPKTGGVGGNSFLGGLEGGGLNLPHDAFQGGAPQISGGPNAVAPQEGALFGGPPGPAPGPSVTNNFNGDYQPFTYHGAPQDNSGMQGAANSWGAAQAQPPSAFDALP